MDPNLVLVCDTDDLALISPNTAAHFCLPQYFVSPKGPLKPIDNE